MVADSYVESLGQMVQLLREYKPGSVTLENITKLCQTLGLESFVDDINNDLARLSTASKIIVIDIDFDRQINKVKDVKLVLASNFDYFNYYIDNYDVTKGESNNILLNSLVLYDDLKQFDKNLQFLYLLDTYSQVDIDNATSTTVTASMTNSAIGMSHNSSMGYNSIDGTMNNVESSNPTPSNANKNGKLDLFKYFTELKQYTIKYFKENNIDLDVMANLNNKIGLYVTKPKSNSVDEDKGCPEIIARITLEKAKNVQHRLFEYVYSDTTKNWINESPDNNICGVSLILEIFNTDMYFPESFITTEMIFEHSPEHSREKNKFVSQLLNNLTINSKDGKEELHLLNDFTTNLINVRKIDISNDNLDILGDILKWMEWYNVVLTPLLTMINKNVKDTKYKDDKKDIHHHHNSHHRRRLMSLSMGTVGIQNPPFRHRRSSSKNKKPSLTESTMLKDEGMQQYNLHEIIAQPVTEESGLSLELDPNNEEALIIDGDEGNNNMDIDIDNAIPSTNFASETKEKQIIISEDHIQFDLNNLDCSLYDTRVDWDAFMEELTKFI